MEDTLIQKWCEPFEYIGKEWKPVPNMDKIWEKQYQFLPMEMVLSHYMIRLHDMSTFYVVCEDDTVGYPWSVYIVHPGEQSEENEVQVIGENWELPDMKQWIGEILQIGRGMCIFVHREETEKPEDNMIWLNPSKEKDQKIVKDAIK